MLQISERQQRSFDRLARDRFVGEMVAHLGPRSPLHLQVLGDAGLRLAIEFGIDRSAAHGYTLRGAVRLWLELMLLFGGLFDEDPLLPDPVRPLLRCDDPDRQLPMAQALQAEACVWIRRVAGPGNRFTRQSLSRIHALASSDWQPGGGSLVDEILAVVAWAHPQQFEWLGADAHRRLIEGAIEQAHRRGIETPARVALFGFLAFLVGAGFARDPLYPWISRTLDDPALADAEARADRLDRRARTYLRHVIANLQIA